MFKLNNMNALFVFLRRHVRGHRPGVLVVLVMVLAGGLQAQPLMELKDFLNVVSKSPRIYQYETTNDPVVTANPYEKLNQNYFRLVDSAGVRFTRPYQISHTGIINEELGWQAYMADEPEIAMEIFQEILDSFPEYTPVMSKIAHVVEDRLGGPEAAIEWYRNALQINPIDYIAAWSLAQVYQRQQDHDNAVHWILYAWIMNRNHRHIRRDVEQIVTGAGYQFTDWDFIPQYQVSEVQGRINLVYQPAWLGYALCQAVWDFEPRFAEQRDIQGNKESFRQRECLACLLNTMRSDKEGSPDLALLGYEHAMKNKMAFEFILFEILLTDKPDMAHLLDQGRIHQLIEYIKSTRMTRP